MAEAVSAVVVSAEARDRVLEDSRAAVDSEVPVGPVVDSVVLEADLVVDSVIPALGLGAPVVRVQVDSGQATGAVPDSATAASVVKAPAATDSHPPAAASSIAFSVCHPIRACIVSVRALALPQVNCRPAATSMSITAERKALVEGRPRASRSRAQRATRRAVPWALVRKEARRRSVGCKARAALQRRGALWSVLAAGSPRAARLRGPLGAPRAPALSPVPVAGSPPVVPWKAPLGAPLAPASWPVPAVRRPDSRA